MSETTGKKTQMGVSARRKRRRGLRIALVTLSTLVLVVVALAKGSYWWFSAKVHEANLRIDQATRDALATPPPSTLVPMAQPSSPENHEAAPGEATAGQAAASQKKPENPPLDIIFLGSDPRPKTVKAPGSSDAMMLIHVDRDNDFLSILSIARDLYVDIPGYGKDRINAAYTFGGPPLTIATIKSVFGVNATKYLQLGLESFRDVVDSIGGVYVDVDRNYPQTETWAVGIPPGYQLLDGAHALSFARYRYDQYSDFGRMARQQRILGALREQMMGWDLALDLPGVVGSLLDAAATNLSANELLGLGRWLATLDGARIKQIAVKGSGQMIDGKAVIVTDQDALENAVTDLLSPPDVNRPATLDNQELLAATGGNVVSLLASPAASLSLPDAAVWQDAQKKVKFPLEAPRFIPEGFSYAYKWPAKGGAYVIKVGDETRPAVRMIYRRKGSDDYLGVTATTWTDAPLASKGMEVEIEGTVYTIVGPNGKVDHIWWKRNDVLYFISNSLMYTVSQNELLDMAASMAPVEGRP